MLFITSIYRLCRVYTVINIEKCTHLQEIKQIQQEIERSNIHKIYREIYKKYGKSISQLKNGVEILLKDMETDINVPVVLKWDGKEFDMIAKTVMRKKNFKSSTKKYSV